MSPSDQIDNDSPMVIVAIAFALSGAFVTALLAAVIHWILCPS